MTFICKVLMCVMIVFGVMRVSSMLSTFVLHNKGLLDFQIREFRLHFVGSCQA